MSTETTQPSYLTAAQTAELMSVKVSTIQRWVRAKRIPCIRVGNTIRFSQEQIEQAKTVQANPLPEKPKKRTKIL